MASGVKNVLVLCTGNSCRSQIAEGYLKFFAGTTAHVYSAGIETHGVNPMAVKTMLADGIDISGQTSNNISEYTSIPFDHIITVCDHARENCPWFPSNGMRHHHNFTDPAKAQDTPEEIDRQFATVRDQIKAYCKVFVEEHLS